MENYSLYIGSCVLYRASSMWYPLKLGSQSSLETTFKDYNKIRAYIYIYILRTQYKVRCDNL